MKLINSSSGLENRMGSKSMEAARSRNGPKERVKSKGAQQPITARMRKMQAGKADSASRKRRASGLDLKPSTDFFKAIAAASPKAVPRVLNSMSESAGQRAKENICRNSTEALKAAPSDTMASFLRRELLW